MRSIHPRDSRGQGFRQSRVVMSKRPGCTTPRSPSSDVSDVWRSSPKTARSRAVASCWKTMVAVAKRRFTAVSSTTHCCHACRRRPSVITVSRRLASPCFASCRRLPAIQPGLPPLSESHRKGQLVGETGDRRPTHRGEGLGASAAVLGYQNPE